MSARVIPHITTLDPKKLAKLLQPIKGVVLDVDGTLTIPGMYRLSISYKLGLINFKSIRERAKIPMGHDIFPYIRSHYQGEEYAQAMKVVEEEELIAQKNVQLQKSKRSFQFITTRLQ